MSPDEFELEEFGEDEEFDMFETNLMEFNNLVVFGAVLELEARFDANAKSMNRIKIKIIFALLLCLVACHRSIMPIAGIYSTEEYDARIGVWYNFSTVNWAMLDTLYYRPYDCDWPDEYVASVGENHIPEEDARVWHLLQNARTKFHQDNLPLRAISTPEQRAHLDQVDAAFDTVFVHYMQDDYYLRAFVDAYEDVLPKQIDGL